MREPRLCKLSLFFIKVFSQLYLLVQSHQQKHQYNEQSLFKFSSVDFIVKTDFAHFFGVFILDFEQVNARW